MAIRCYLCGRKAWFGTIFRCVSCGEYFCSRHESEQFVQYNTVVGGKGWTYYSSYNYPDGRSVTKDNFICYKCRTGEEPTDGVLGHYSHR